MTGCCTLSTAIKNTHCKGSPRVSPHNNHSFLSSVIVLSGRHQLLAYRTIAASRVRPRDLFCWFTRLTESMPVETTDMVRPGIAKW